MGLFKKETCVLCGDEAGSGRIKRDDGSSLCSNCVRRIKISPGFTKDMVRSSSLDVIQDRIAYAEKDYRENKEKHANFASTYQIGGYIWFDDTHKWFVFPKGTIKFSIEDSYIFKYEDLLGFEIIEDGEAVSKGSLGKAVIGGAVFGLAGAIVGGTSKKSTSVCNRMYVSIMTANPDYPVTDLNLISNETQKKSFLYKLSVDNSHAISAKLNSIIEQNKQVPVETPAVSAFSAADELKKFKELLDMSVITQEEFEVKKKELLNL